MSKQPRIGAYEFGHSKVDGQMYTCDIILLPTGVKSNWWREERHTLKPSDLAPVLDAASRTLVVGQGAHECMPVPDETLAYLREVGIEVLYAPTAEAVAIYNERCQQDEAVAGAFHLTC
jgi:hypothetical protein